MAYVLEPISREDQKMIMEDAKYDDKRYNRLRARGGYFEKLALNPVWAVDRDKGYYFFRAPGHPFDLIRTYYFFYENHIYLLIRDKKISDGKFLSTGHFDEKFDEFKLKKLEQEIKLAYLCFGPSGRGQVYKEPLDLQIIQPRELICR